MSQPRISFPDGWKRTGHLLRDSTMGLVPETLDHYIPLNKMIWFDGPLSSAELELMRLRNARKVGCVYCKAVRYDVAIEAGLDESRIAQIEDGFEKSCLSDREKLILKYTDQYLDAPDAMTQTLKDEMTDLFTREEIIHLSLALILFNSLSRGAVTFGGMPEQDLPRMEISVPV